MVLPCSPSIINSNRWYNWYRLVSIGWDSSALSLVSLTHIYFVCSGHRGSTSSDWRWPSWPRSFTTLNAFPLSPFFLQAVKSSPTYTGKLQWWYPLMTHVMESWTSFLPEPDIFFTATIFEGLCPVCGSLWVTGISSACATGNPITKIQSISIS